MANMDRPKKMLVRTAFVTGTTMATLLGAQTLALLDQRSLTPPSSGSLETIPPSPLVVATAQPADTSPAALLHVAPSIVILREPGQAAVNNGQLTSAQPSAAQSSTVAIQPPSPVQLSAPAPIIVQQPGGGGQSPSDQAQAAPVTTQSSR